MRDIFIIGSKGIPAQYGGFETFVDNLVSRRNNDKIQYHVACMGNSSNEFEYNQAHCFTVKVLDIGPAKAVYYDLAALRYCIAFIKKHSLKNSIIYILACRIGPFIGHYKKILLKMNAEVYVNPDGHEWMRAKWNCIIRKYWKLSERLMVKHADLLICDSKNIEKYIRENYKFYYPKTVYIAYGAEIRQSPLADDAPEFISWCKKYGITAKNYYLIVGRFVPENNYETMINEFMQSKTKKDLVIITNYKGTKLYKNLKNKLHFEEDPRIKFVGTVYEKDILKKIRENAYGYLHGHEVGGTNPSLLEALSSTELNLLLDIAFNRECGKDGAFYWTKTPGDLTALLGQVERMKRLKIEELGIKARKRMEIFYNWSLIVRKYETIFQTK